MRRVILAGAGLLLLCLPQMASAQDMPPGSPAVVAQAAPTIAQPLRAGAAILVELADSVDSRSSHRGDLITLRLAESIMLDGEVVVPAGVTGVGEVIEASPSGALGRPAKLSLVARYLSFNGARIPLRGLQLGRRATDNSDVVMAVAFIPYVGLAGMFMHGGEITIPGGALARAKLAADLDASGAVIAPAAPPNPVQPSEGSK